MVRWNLATRVLLESRSHKYLIQFKFEDTQYMQRKRENNVKAEAVERTPSPNSKSDYRN